MSPPSAPVTDPAPPESRRVWTLALGTAAICYLDPALVDMAELVGKVALSSNKSLAHDAITELRRKACELRRQMAPLPASALAKVVRRTEAAGGAVLDKGARVQELQASWDQFLSCLRCSRQP